ncbi:MAG: LysM peptidoglycan-binding domain-containing protein [Myxococcota bacterium]
MSRAAGLFALLLSACGGTDDPAELQTITVQKGDYLYKLARQHGVTVDELRSWNALSSDALEPGQTLILKTGTPASPTPTRQQTSHRTKPVAATTPAPRRGKPRPKPCLPPPAQVADDEGMAASVGLSASQTRSAVETALPHLPDCIAGSLPSGTAWFQLEVGCDGVVDRATPTDSAGWPDTLLSCVATTLEHVSFPAHDLPGGDTVQVPIGFGG